LTSIALWRIIGLGTELQHYNRAWLEAHRRHWRLLSWPRVACI